MKTKGIGCQSGLEDGLTGYRPQVIGLCNLELIVLYIYAYCAELQRLQREECCDLVDMMTWMRSVSIGEVALEKDSREALATAAKQHHFSSRLLHLLTLLSCFP